MILINNQMKKFEYSILDILEDKFQESDLNELGNEGWELVQILVNSKAAIFKREIKL